MLSEFFDFFGVEYDEFVRVNNLVFTFRLEFEQVMIYLDNYNYGSAYMKAVHEGYLQVMLEYCLDNDYALVVIDDVNEFVKSVFEYGFYDTVTQLSLLGKYDDLFSDWLEKYVKASHNNTISFSGIVHSFNSTQEIPVSSKILEEIIDKYLLRYDEHGIFYKGVYKNV